MTRTIVHPGEHLAEELEAINMSAAELARQLKLPKDRLVGILKGQRAITSDTALRLAYFFGTSASFWLNLQNQYDLKIAREKVGNAIKELPTVKRGRQ